MHVGIFDPAMGGDPVLYQHFFWFYSHPVVYVMILPGDGHHQRAARGALARKHIFGYRAIAFSSLGIAAVSFLVWGHHIFTAMGELAAVLFSALTFLVAIPTAIKVFNWIATLYKGSIVLNTPMSTRSCSCSPSPSAGSPGLPLGALATDLHLHDSYFVVAHFHYVMMGGTVIAIRAASTTGGPRCSGRCTTSPAHSLGCTVLVFIGFNVTFFTQFFLGTQGMPRRYASYVDDFQLPPPRSRPTARGSWGWASWSTCSVFIHSL